MTTCEVCPRLRAKVTRAEGQFQSAARAMSVYAEMPPSRILANFDTAKARLAEARESLKEHEAVCHHIATGDKVNKRELSAVLHEHRWMPTQRVPYGKCACFPVDRPAIPGDLHTQHQAQVLLEMYDIRSKE